MTLDGFRDLIDSLGPDIARWPAPQKTEAEQLLLSSPQARQLLAEAVEVEDALHSVPPVKAPEGLLDRICEAIKDENTSSGNDV
jgi:hypothetical protein